MGTNKNSSKKNKVQKKRIEAGKSKKNQSLMAWTLGIILLASIAAIVFKGFSDPQTAKPVDAKVFQYEKQPALGVQEAPVKIVEFADFKCPSCQQFDKAILPQIKKEFIDNGTVQFYFINYPVVSPNGDSRTAAMAGEAVYSQNPEEFWKFYEAVYAQQKDESQTWATSDFLVDIARQAQLSIDLGQLKKDIDDETFSEQVKMDEQIGNQIGVRGTPTIFINGKMISAQETFQYDAIKEAIVQARDEKK